MFDFTNYHVTADDCERCFDCVTACPRGVLEAGEDGPIIAHPEECMGCRVCLGVCRQMGLRMIWAPYLDTLVNSCKIAS